MCKIMDPTEKGVWWKDDGQWVLSPPEIAAKIERAKSIGATNITVGPLRSSRYPSGTNYAIDLLTMKQKILTTGFSGDIKIIPASSAQEQEESEEDVNDSASPTFRRMARDESKKEEAGKYVVRLVPSITVDLQKLSSNCLADDALFRAAEKGNAEAGDHVEYVFKGSSVDEGRSVFEPAQSGVVTGFTRLLPLPSEGGREVSVYLTMCEFVQGTRYLTVVKGEASLFIAQLVPMSSQFADWG